MNYDVEEIRCVRGVVYFGGRVGATDRQGIELDLEVAATFPLFMHGDVPKHAPTMKDDPYGAKYVDCSCGWTGNPARAESSARSEWRSHFTESTR